MLFRSGGQWFVCIDCSTLDPNYTIFGKVVEGMDVADAIVGVRTTTKGPYGDVPVEPIVIKKASIVQ